MDDTRDDRYEPMVGFIRRFIREHGYSPSIREMGDGLGHTSTSVTNYWMNHLRRQRRITFVDSQSRTVRVADDDDGIVIRLSGDEARMFRDAVGPGDPKESVMEAVHRDLHTKARRPATNSS